MNFHMIIKPILAIISFILTTTLVIGIHELAHAYMARLFAIRVTRISLGFGKALLSYQGKDCSYVISRWPIGGYVKLLNTRIEKVPKQDLPFAFDKRPLSQKFLVLIAGSLINIIAAFIFFTIYFLIGH